MDPTDPFADLPPDLGANPPSPLPPPQTSPPSSVGDGSILPGVVGDLASEVLGAGVEAGLDGALSAAGEVASAAVGAVGEVAGAAAGAIGESAGSLAGEALGGCASAGCSCLVLLVLFLAGFSGVVLACVS
jgi:hypothetical protein